MRGPERVSATRWQVSGRNSQVSEGSIGKDAQETRTSNSPRGTSLHSGYVQQYDRDDHGHERKQYLLGERGIARVQRCEEVYSVCGADDCREWRAKGSAIRTPRGACLFKAAGSRPRVGHTVARWSWTAGSQYQRRHTDPAQRVSAAEVSSGVAASSKRFVYYKIPTYTSRLTQRSVHGTEKPAQGIQAAKGHHV